MIILEINGLALQFIDQILGNKG